MTRKKKAAATPEELKELKEKLDTLDFEFLVEASKLMFQKMDAGGEKSLNIMLTSWQAKFFYRFEEKHLITLRKIGLLRRTAMKSNPEAQWSMIELQKLFITHPKMLIGIVPGY